MTHLFDIADRVSVITGAIGALVGSAADYLAAQGARIAYLGTKQEKLDRPTLERDRDAALVKGADGNMPGATIPPDESFSDLDFESFQQVVDSNLHGTVLSSLVFTPATAGVYSFTRWLAVDMAKRTAGKVRVNAIMPGFFLGEQNRRLLTNEDGSLTDRGNTIIANTPFGRFGHANELFGAVHYLLADASQFVTGTVLAADGGFVSFSGV